MQDCCARFYPGIILVKNFFLQTGNEKVDEKKAEMDTNSQKKRMGKPHRYLNTILSCIIAYV
jgi:hypothetical protein